MPNLPDPEDFEQPNTPPAPPPAEEQNDLDKQEQIELAERLQTKWLRRMEKLIDNGDATSTDMATLMRFLVANGWNLDPSRLPKGLQDTLTSHIKPGDFNEDDGIIPIRRQA